MLTLASAASQAEEAIEVEASESLAPKAFLRASAGIIKNVGTQPGSTPTFGGANLGGAFFITKQISVGLAYKAETTFKAIPLKGIDIFIHYYILGQGTAVTTRDSNGNKIVTQKRMNIYAGPEFSNRQYNLELAPEALNPADRSISGTISAANVTMGFDYRMSRHWEANFEASYTLLPFGGSDSRVKIKWMLASFGANYVF